MQDTLEFHYSVINQTSPELPVLIRIGTWMQATLRANTYGFDLQTNTWKFAYQDDYVLFLLTWLDEK